MSAAFTSTSDAYERGLALAAHGRHVDALEQYELALQLRPEDLRVVFALGNTARALGLDKLAEEFYRRVLAREPARLEALVNLANLLRAHGRAQDAAGLLRPALAALPDAPELFLTLGSAFREMGATARAAGFYRKALALRPNYAAALANLAELVSDEGRSRDALALYDRAIANAPESAQAKLNRAILHLAGGELKRGWCDYEARLEIKDKTPLSGHRLARWNGSFAKSTRLLVTAEQGIGDQIMFASVLPDLTERARSVGARVVVECEPRLVPLFARSFPDMAVYPCDFETREGVARARYDWLKRAGGANAAVPLGSLPRLLRPALERFPTPHRYLHCDGAEHARWKDFLAASGTPPYFGLCWRSGKMTAHRAKQYAPLEAWASFVAQLSGTLVCVQYDADEEEVSRLANLSGRSLALISSLDAVISAPTSVAWLAAGAGVPTYKILFDNSWTSFGQEIEPFAPSCRCMMPATPGDWSTAFAQALALIKAPS